MMEQQPEDMNSDAQSSPPGFEGLTEADIQALKTHAAVRKLKRGDFLIREGHTDQAAYIILDGTVKIVKMIKGRLLEAATLNQGDWLGEIAFAMRIPRTASAVAMVPTTVMVLDQPAVEALDHGLQAYVYRRLNDLAARRISELSMRETELAAKNAALVEYIHAFRGRGKTDYGSSEMIRDIIARMPRLPAFATTLAVRMLDENISAGEVGDGVKQDPSLAALILKRVNSSYYGFQRKIGDVQQAVVLLGLNEVYQLVLTEGIRRTMPDTPVFRSLLTHSVAVSHLSFAISQTSRVGRPTEAATIGLLHALGLTVIQLLKDKNRNMALLIDKLDKSQLGAILLKEWNLPETIHRTVEHQSTPEFSPPDMVPEDVRKDVAALYVAQMAAGFIQGLTEHEMPMVFFSDYAALLGWEEFTLPVILDRFLIPVLVRNLSTFPMHFREALAEYKPEVFREKRRRS